ncbi:MAG: hypothetical protein HUJ72_00145 [Blautia sp.]|nr:hypothetical protein [Blautia sp.]
MKLPEKADTMKTDIASIRSEIKSIRAEIRNTGRDVMSARLSESDEGMIGGYNTNATGLSL